MDSKQLKIITQIIISGLLLMLSVYLIISEPEDSVKLKWAFGIVGIVIGYWLK